MAAVSSSSGNSIEERRKRVFVGALPADFLRIAVTHKQQQEAADQQTAMALHHQYISGSFVQNTVGRLNITVAQAKLVKNYGMTRMDPYVRLRVGHCTYETQTDTNGGRNPHWNKVVQCLLPQGVNTIYIEIYDECSFTVDELIAWAHIPIPQAVMNGETIEDWYPLCGKQGDGKEGLINLVLSCVSGPRAANQCLYGPSGVSPPVMMVPSTTSTMFGIPQFAPVPVFTQMTPPPTVDSSQSLQQIEEMFPNMDKEVIKSVFEANNGDRDATVNSLLQISSG
ncbi:Hypothetical protein NTJ_02700 [Nesidiocoris tenuis]|uniref:CUE domain-containing protein n=1 Tax=Nesidiocoris tenuis TaxID=355587 RepID=A0ABN7AC82_9HEMI|nr:Hypothetical protein NTJ_02700 [Nesidiocoris tenuis]